MMSKEKADKWDLRMLNLADHISAWSKDPSTKCGAVIAAPDRTIVSMGYNGFPRGMDDNPVLYEERQIKYERIVHCEMNAILSSYNSVIGCTLYTFPLISCSRCAVHIIQAGIMRCVAPRIPQDQATRWATDCEKTRKYFKEAQVSFTEIDMRTGMVFNEYDAIEDQEDLNQIAELYNQEKRKSE